MTDIEKTGLQFIGASVQAHGYFFTTDVLTANGHPSERLIDFTKEEFLQMVADYSDLNKNLYSISDQEDITKAKGGKRFIRKHIDDESINIGLEWIKDHIFKK